MTCSSVTFRTFDYSFLGIRTVTAMGDGASISLEWYKSYVTPSNFNLFYNIYFSTNEDDVYSEGVKFITNSTTNSIVIKDNFKNGDVYYFCVRATAFEPGTFDFSQLQLAAPNLAIYPDSTLTSNISKTTVQIPVQDASIFPQSGIIRIGAELIEYVGRDLVDNLLIASQRGFYGTLPTIHQTNGFDGYNTYDPFVKLFIGFEDGNSVIGLTENKFIQQYPHNQDGYMNRTDIVTSQKDLAVVAAANDGFPAYDYSGYHRTNPADLLAGKCIGTYIGGTFGCADGYNSLGTVRGLPVQDQNTQRQEVLLETTGNLCILFKRLWEGVPGREYGNTRENLSYRGTDNYGALIVNGYEQYFSPRRSDGKIFVRFSPTKENYERQESGLENVFNPDCWTLVVPTIKDGDFIVRFNLDGSEEWRYEISDVTRNVMFLQDTGMQRFSAFRVRRTDPIYQVKCFRDASMYPSEITTSISSVANLIPPHTHRIIKNEKDPSNWTQMTSVSFGHNHAVSFVSGKLIVNASLGHSHNIVIV